jgi:hypothetical protein
MYIANTAIRRYNFMDFYHIDNLGNAKNACVAYRLNNLSSTSEPFNHIQKLNKKDFCEKFGLFSENNGDIRYYHEYGYIITTENPHYFVNHKKIAGDEYTLCDQILIAVSENDTYNIFFEPSDKIDKTYKKINKTYVTKLANDLTKNNLEHNCTTSHIDKISNHVNFT